MKGGGWGLSYTAGMSPAVSRRFWAVLLTVLGFSGLSSGQTTTRVSTNSTGIEGNNISSNCAISADGRYVAFESIASNLVPGDTNGCADIFLRDRQTGTIERISVDSSGTESNGKSLTPFISGNGRFVSFLSSATNLVPGDTNAVDDVFVRDRLTGKTERASLDSSGNQANNHSAKSAPMTPDGRYVVFLSSASNLVSGDSNGYVDVFVRDRQTSKTEIVSISSTGFQGNRSAYSAPSISADGRFVAFQSAASNLVLGDSNFTDDIFVRDRQTAKTERVSVNVSNQEGNSGSYYPAISGDGRFVVFESTANNLVTGDTNNAVDIFLRDRQTSLTTRLSVSSTGAQANSGSVSATISADGRTVAFCSSATNLISGDVNSRSDDFVRDLSTGLTEILTIDSNSVQANEDSTGPSMSDDGRVFAFWSSASNLVANDTNGCEDVFVRDRGIPLPPPVERAYNTLFSNPLGANGEVTMGMVCDNLAWTAGDDRNRVTFPLSRTLAGSRIWGIVLNSGGTARVDELTGGHVEPGIASTISNKMSWVPPLEFASTAGDINPNLRVLRLELHVLTAAGQHYRTVRDFYLGRAVTVLVHDIAAAPDEFEPLVSSAEAKSLPWVAVDHSDVTGGNGPVELGAQRLQSVVRDTLTRLRSGSFNEARTYGKTKYRFTDYRTIKLSAKRVNLVGWGYGSLIARWYIGATGGGPTGTGATNNSVDWYRRLAGRWYQNEDAALPSLKDSLTTTPIAFGKDVRKLLTVGGVWRGVPACNWTNEVLDVGGPADLRLGDAPSIVEFKSLSQLVQSAPQKVGAVTLPAAAVASQEVMAVESPWLRWITYRRTPPASGLPAPFQADVAYSAIAGDANERVGVQESDANRIYDGLDLLDWFDYFGLVIRDGETHGFSDGFVPLWSQVIPGGSPSVFSAAHDEFVKSSDVRSLIIKHLSGDGPRRGAELNTKWADASAYVESRARANGGTFRWTFDPALMAPWPESAVFASVSSPNPVGRLVRGSIQDGWEFAAVGANGKVTFRWKTLIPMTRAVLHVGSKIADVVLSSGAKGSPTAYSAVLSGVPKGTFGAWIESFYESSTGAAVEQRVRHVSRTISVTVK